MSTETAVPLGDARDRHRPNGLEGVRVAVIELRRQGLRDRDIAAALRVSPEAVRSLLERAA